MWGGRRLVAGLLVMGALLTGVAGAGGPRYVTGRPFYTGTQGVAVVWQQSSLLYFTDPGALSASVNHGAADALVAAAAGVWNVPVASITVGKGGGLAEHVSGANTYLGTNGMVWPADVASSNSAAVPVAVVYDSDGSVTDLLLGVGASDPTECRQNGVTESVDGFGAAGYIQHAIVVVNGRCTGPAAAQQLQLQYQLERVFGRVLGLAWSQANDNVFTGTPQPTYDQAMHWPIMHPLDIICGTYTYQCLPSPFTLRPDDINGLVYLYPNAQGAALGAGKQVSLAAAEGVFGQVSFPTGQGMAGVNMLAQRESSATGALEGWVEASAVTGTTFRRNGRSPFVGADTSSTGSEGSDDQSLMGRYLVAYLPLQAGTTEQTVVVSTEKVNALYTGTHSVEPYAAGIVTPSGSAPAPVVYPQATSNGDVYGFFTVGDAAASCGTGLDGTAAAPVGVAASGWWNGLICGYGHASYLSLGVRAGRSVTVQVTATDEQGFATTGKLMPVIGAYAPTDQGTALPSVAAATGAFNALGLGTTTLTFQPGQTSATTQVRIGIADQRGDGRPDFGFQGRVLYADTVLPARLPPAGGTVTVSGMGFRIGNRVQVNGVTMTVTSWTSTQMVVTVPAMTAVGATNGVGVDVVVTDLSTGATSTMTGALTYDNSSTLPNGMTLVSAPQGTVAVGSVATPAFAVKVVAGDGVTPVVGDSVVFSATAGAVLFSACGAATCTVLTDSTGTASSGVTAQAVGAVTVQAVDGALSETASFTAVKADGSLVVVSAPVGSLPNDSAASTPFAVRVLAADGTTGVAGRQVTFTVTQGAATYGGCSSATCAVVTDGGGNASVTVTPTAAGAVTLQAADGALTQSASFVSADSTDTMQAVAVPGQTAYTGQAPGFSVRLLHADGVTPDAYKAVVFSVAGGAILYPCGAATCAQNTGSDGTASVSVSSQTAGMSTVTATFGTLTQTASVTFSRQASQMVLLSAPTGTQAVGSVTSRPFSVQLLGANGSPMTGVPVPMDGPLDQIMLGACSRGGCLLYTDDNGIITSTITPLRAGVILVTTQYGTLNQTISFSAVGASETMNVLVSPGAGTFTGDLESFLVQVIQKDGVTPAAGETVKFSVSAGSFAFSGCASATCAVTTDANGQAAMTGVALAAGAGTVLASDGAVSQAMSFTTTAHADVMQRVSGPSGSVYVGSAAATPFAVKVFAADGVTPAVGRAVTFAVTVGSASYSACAVAPCVVTTDANGMATVTVTPLAAGATSLVAADGAASVAVSFTALPQPDRLLLVSAPGSTGMVGDVEAASFAVQVMHSDGSGPEAGKSVAFTVTAGSAQLGVCGGAACTVTTGSDGMASTTVTPLAEGTIGLLAAEGVLTQSASFVALPKPDRLALVSAPGSSVFVGATAASAYAVRLTLADGVTPVGGTTVTFTNGGSGMGQAQFVACGAAICAVATDSTGMAATAVAGTVAGAANLTAAVTLATGVQSLSTPIQVVADQESLNASNAAVFVADGSSFSYTLQATALFNGALAATQAVSWTSQGAITLGGASSTTDVAGVARMQALVGPLAGGVGATAQACAWTSACTTFHATGVAAAALAVQVTSGGIQTVAAGGTAVPVVALVTDGAGDAVAGATVTVYQTVSAAAAACPAKGRCPSVPVLNSGVSLLLSDANGMVSVQPMAAEGVATETKVLLTVGTRGSASAEVWSQASP